MDLVIDPTQGQLDRFLSQLGADAYASQEAARQALRQRGMFNVIDLILSKLEWNRITPSERQLRDVAGVAKVRLATLDLAYLRKWAAVLGVADTLKEVLRQTAAQQPR